MSAVRYLVTWVDAEEIKAAAKKAGMPADCDSILDYAPPEEHQSSEHFSTASAAIRWATAALARDFFGQVEIEEQVEEVEALEGDVFRSWETVRYRHVDERGPSEWEIAQ